MTNRNKYRTQKLEKIPNRLLYKVMSGLSERWIGWALLLYILQEKQLSRQFLHWCSVPIMMQQALARGLSFPSHCSSTFASQKTSQQKKFACKFDTSITFLALTPCKNTRQNWGVRPRPFTVCQDKIWWVEKKLVGSQNFCWACCLVGSQLFVGLQHQTLLFPTLQL